jgi:multidrug efflux pump subunit AcrB
MALRDRFNISRLAIKYSWLTVGFWLAVAVAGIFAFSSLKYALFPDIAFPVVVVSTSAPFSADLSSAIDTEKKITQPIEQQLKDLEGLDKLRSITYPGQSVINMAFLVGTDLDESRRQVETILKNITLPKDASYKVIPLNLNESSAVSYAIQSSTDSLSAENLTQLTQLTKTQILPVIDRLPGVLKVNLLGAPSPIVPAQAIDPALLAKQQQLAGKKIPLNPNIKPSPAIPPGLGLPQGGSAVRFNGRDALAFQVIKRGDANTLEVASDVETAVALLRARLPSLEITLAATQADYIREASHATIDSLLLAIALSVLIIYPFLRNWKATLITALAIPTSLLGTFIVMAIFGLNLETITLLALALVVGIIVDDAIVDVENIARHVDEGESPYQAAVKATSEIGLTVTAATFTIVAVFLPVAFMGGGIGQFFKPFGLTVSASVIISLLVARTLSPLLAAGWLKPNHKNRSQSTTEGLAWYRHLLQWSLGHRWLVLGLAILSFVAGLLLIPLIPQGFIPKLDRGEFNITYAAPANTSLDESRQIAQKLELVARRSPTVEAVFTTVGSRQGEANKGNLYVKLKHERDRIHTAEVQDQVRQALPAIANVTVSVEDIQFVDTGSEKPLQVALVGDDASQLSATAKKLKTLVQAMPGLVDVTATGEMNSKDSILEIQHLNTQRVAYIGANLDKSIALGDATNQVVAATKDILPPGVKINLGGDSERIGEIFGSFGKTLGLSVLCILIVLILLFRSLIDPLVIVLALPLSVIGALLALLLTRSDFGMIAVIGMVFLFGLINKNAILIVDYINQLRRDGLDRNEAILKACPIRLRPIAMTTASTILGMLPIALGIGAGSELRSPMAVSIIGGLTTSTLLSLIVIPVIYSLLDDLQPRFSSKNKNKPSLEIPNQSL